MKTFKILVGTLFLFSLIVFQTWSCSLDDSLVKTPSPPEHLGLDALPLIVPSPEVKGDYVKFTFSWTQTNPPADSFKIEKKIIREGITKTIDVVNTLEVFNTLEVEEVQVGDIFIIEVSSIKDGQKSEPVVLTYRYDDSILIDDIVMGLTNDQERNRDCICDVPLQQESCIRIRLMEPGGEFTGSLSSLNPYRHFFYPKTAFCDCLNNSVTANDLIKCAKTVGLKEVRNDPEFKGDCQECQ